MRAHDDGMQEPARIHRFGKLVDYLGPLLAMALADDDRSYGKAIAVTSQGSHDTSPMTARAVLIATGSMSQPIACRPIERAASSVVPPPRNGSTTSAPGFVSRPISSLNASKFCPQGCRSLP